MPHAIWATEAGARNIPRKYVPICATQDSKSGPAYTDSLQQAAWCLLQRQPDQPDQVLCCAMKNHNTISNFEQWWVHAPIQGADMK
eukprot:7344049-Ditylum_brightwellii.AAC.1